MAQTKDQSVPEAWQAGKLPYSAGITLALAKKMLEAAEAEAKKQGLSMVMAIVDAGGHLVAVHRMDNSMLASINIAMDKAFTAVYGKLPSQAWRSIIQEGHIPPLFIHERWAPFSGGFPMVKEGQLWGGVGASGATAHGDTSVARAALLAGGFSTSDADAILAELG